MAWSGRGHSIRSTCFSASQIEIRPEVCCYRSLDALAFNGSASLGIAPDKNFAIIGVADMTAHFGGPKLFLRLLDRREYCRVRPTP